MASKKIKTLTEEITTLEKEIIKKKKQIGRQKWKERKDAMLTKILSFKNEHPKTYENILENTFTYSNWRYKKEALALVYQERIIKGNTLQSVGDIIGVSKGRIREIEAKLYKMINGRVDYNMGGNTWQVD